MQLLLEGKLESPNRSFVNYGAMDALFRGGLLGGTGTALSKAVPLPRPKPKLPGCRQQTLQLPELLSLLPLSPLPDQGKPRVQSYVPMLSPHSVYVHTSKHSSRDIPWSAPPATAGDRGQSLDGDANTPGKITLNAWCL